MVAAAWVFATFAVRLPFDLLLCALDSVWVNLLKQIGGGRLDKKPCLIVDALSGNLCCAVSRKYKNRWLFRLVCPHIGSRPMPGVPYSPCTARPDSIRPLWLRLAAAVVLASSPVLLWRAWPSLHELPAMVTQAAAPIFEAMRKQGRASQPAPDEHGIAKEAAAAADVCFEREDYARAARQYMHALNVDPALVHAQYKLGLCHLALGDKAAARLCLRAALALKPNWPEATLELARLERSLGNMDAAVDLAERVLEADPENHEALDVLSPARPAQAAAPADSDDGRCDPAAAAMLGRNCRALFEKGQFAEAREYARRALALMPANVAMKVLLAKCLIETGERGQAKPILREILTNEPGRTDLRLELAACYDEDGESRLAEVEYRTALRADPKCVKAHLWLAEAYLKRGDIERAYSHSNAAIAQVQKSDETPVEARALAPRTKAAEPDAHGRAASAPKRPDRPQIRSPASDAGGEAPAQAAPSSLGFLPTRLASTRRPKAKPPRIEEQAPTAQLGAPAPEPRLAIAQACKRRAELMRVDESLARGDTGQAKDVARSLSMQGDEVHAALALAFVHQSERDLAQAKKEYDRALEADPTNLTALANLACVLADEGKQCARAVELAEQAYEREPANVRFADVYGWMQVRFGSDAKGIKMLRDLAAQHPNDSLVRMHLGMAYLGMGNYRKAKVELRAVVALNADAADAAKARTILARLSD